MKILLFFNMSDANEHSTLTKQLVSTVSKGLHYLFTSNALHSLKRSQNLRRLCHEL